MVKLIAWLDIITKGIVASLFPILSLILFLKKKCFAHLLFFMGLFTIGIGALVQKLSPVYNLSIDEAKRIVSSIGIPTSWYIGSFITYLGIILTAVGFALLVFKNNLKRM